LALFREKPGVLPGANESLARLDTALASAAMEIGLIRHAGTLERVYTPAGMTYVQTGKDLTRVGTLLLTGGSLVHGGSADRIARYALESGDEPSSLKPREARVVLDRQYIVAAMGLLGEYYPQAAFAMMQRSFQVA